MDKDTADELLKMLKKVDSGTPHFFAYHPGDAEDGARLALNKRRLPKAEITAWKKEGLTATKMVTGKARKGEGYIEFATTQKNIPGGLQAMQRILRKLGLDEAIPPLKKAVPVIDLALDMKEEDEKTLAGVVASGGLTDKVQEMLLALDGQLKDLEERAVDDDDMLADLVKRQKEQIKRHGELKKVADVATGDPSAVLEAQSAVEEGGDLSGQAGGVLTDLAEPVSTLLESLVDLGSKVPKQEALKLLSEEKAKEAVADVQGKVDQAIKTRKTLVGKLMGADNKLDQADEMLDLGEELLAALKAHQASTKGSRERAAAVKRLKATSSRWFTLSGDAISGLADLASAVGKEDDDRSKAISKYLEALTEGIPFDLSDTLGDIAKKVEKGKVEATDGDLLRAGAQITQALEFLEANMDVLALAEQNPYSKKVSATKALMEPLLATQGELELIPSLAA